MSDINLSTNIGGLGLKCCVYNASGPRCGTLEALLKIGESGSGAIVSKSATLEKQDGNELPRSLRNLYLGDGLCEGSFNSEGLPNLGIDNYIQAETELRRFDDKPYIVSLSGHTVDDNCEMLRRILSESCIQGVELNLACPNIHDRPIVAYDFSQMEHCLQRICAVYDEFALEERKSDHSNGLFEVKLGVKLAPYLDTSLARSAIDVILPYKRYVRYIVTCNAIGNALFVDTDHECCSIRGKNGLGGLGGGYVKQISLGNVYTLHQLLHECGASEDIDIVGVGGIRTGEDAFQSILCGAKAVQLGTCHWLEGPECFDRVAAELRAIMQSKGYSCVEDFRGKLKAFVKHPNKNSTHHPKSTENSNGSAALVAVLATVVAILFSRILDMETLYDKRAFWNAY